MTSKAAGAMLNQRSRSRRSRADAVRATRGERQLLQIRRSIKLANHAAAELGSANLAVAFRLRDPVTWEWRLTSSSAEAKTMVASGDWELVDVPFAANPSNRYVTDVVELRNSQRNDTVYSANPRQIRQLERAGYQNLGTALTAYDQPLRDLDPIWQLISASGQHRLASSRHELRQLLDKGWGEESIAFYSVAFPNAA